MRLLFALCYILFAQCGHSPHISDKGNTFTIYEDLPFSKTDQQLTLDLFVPDQQLKPVPCILIVQGGGFKPQDGQRFRHYAEYIAGSNYAAALISYRGRPKHHYMETIQDVKSAVRYIRKNSSKYLIQPNQVGAVGKSAGGTLAALLAVTEDDSFGQEVPEVSAKVQAAVALAGVFNFITRFSDSLQIALQADVDIRRASNEEWIGSPFSVEDQHWENASPRYHLDKNDSPMLFIHCKDDGSVPWLQSQEMYESMQALDITAQLLYFDRGGHGFQSGDQGLYLDPMMEFFRMQFE